MRTATSNNERYYARFETGESPYGEKSIFRREFEIIHDDRRLLFKQNSEKYFSLFLTLHIYQQAPHKRSNIAQGDCVLNQMFFSPKCFLLRKQNGRGLMLPARSSFTVGCLRRAARSPRFSRSYICLLINCEKKFVRSKASLYIPSYIDVYPYIRTYWYSFNLCVCNVKINTTRYSQCI